MAFLSREKIPEVIRLSRLAKACAAALLASSAVVSYSVNALGLGEVQVASKLNEPFSARIEVLSATASEIGSLRVGLAGEEAWRRSGLTPQGSASQIRFGFVATGGGNLAITLKTDQPVREPLLVFLVDASWNAGHLLREYTVFLDPESLPQPTLAPVSPPVVNTVPELGAPSAPAIARSALGGDYGPVSRGQSLGQIAEELIAGTDIRRNQMVWALFQLNPQAFTDNNINWLNVGAQLQVPSYEEAAAISPARAAGLVSQATRPQKRSKPVVPEANPSTAQPLSNQSPLSSPPVSPQRKQEATSEELKPSEPEQTVAKVESPQTQATKAIEPPSVDKLELLPIEPALAESIDDSKGSGVYATPDFEGDQADKNLVGAASGSAEAGQATTQREQELNAENALLRERINETEALLKEIRGLLAARSEQLASLQSRLDKIESTASSSNNNTVTANTSQNNPIGWFWWLLLVLAIVILLLLIVLLVLLTRRNTRDQVSKLSQNEEPSVEKAGKPERGNAVSAPAVVPLAQAASAKQPEPQAKDPLEAAIVPAPIESPVDGGAKEQAEPEQSQSEPLVADSALDEQREATDDAPLEFDVSGYTGAKDNGDSELSEVEQNTVAADLAAELELPPLEELPDVIPEPLASSVAAQEVDAFDVALDEPPTAEPESVLEADDLLDEEPDLPPVVGDADLDLIELDAGLIEPDPIEESDSDEVPAIEGAVDVSDFSGGDQVATKLDLARVYADMGDADEARSILEEVLQEGSEGQKQEAQSIIDTLS